MERLPIDFNGVSNDLKLVLSVFRSAILSFNSLKSISSTADRVKFRRALEPYGSDKVVDECFQILAELEDDGFLYWNEILDFINQVIISH